MKKLNIKLPNINFKKLKEKKPKNKIKKPLFSFGKKEEKVVTLIKDNMYIYEKNNILKDKIHSTKGIITSTVSFKDVVNISFKLSSALLEDELLMEAEKYVYDQNILDMTKEYQIIYNFQKYDEFYYVDAFAIEVENLKSLMSKYLTEFKYIDFISFSPFAFKEFYELTNTSPMVDVFIYFDTEESYIVGFKGGEFTFIRGLEKFSILQKELNKSTKEVIEILKINGVDRNRHVDEYTYEIIDTFFSKFFMKVNNVINYSINFFKLDRVNRIYFYSPFEINGLIENYKEFWNLSHIEFDKYSIGVKDYDPFEYTLAIYNSKYYSKDNLNFSIFKRPPPFYKREGGKLILFTSFLVIVLGIDAAYKGYVLSQLEQQRQLIELQASNYKNKLKQIKQKIKMYEAQAKSAKKELSKLSKQVDKIYQKVETLYKADNAPIFTNEYVKIVSLFKKYGLKIYEFKKMDDKFSIIILSSQAVYDNIPMFLTELKKIGFKNINANLIENNSTAYKTKVVFYE